MSDRTGESLQRNAEGESIARREEQTKEPIDHDFVEVPVVPYYYPYSRYYRWLLMLFYLTISMIAGPSTFNWPPFDEMFNWANANAHLCNPSDPSYEVRAYDEIFCDAKTLENENIAGISSSITYIFDFVGGIMLDSVGAKVTCVFGLTLQVLGWLMLAVSKPFGFRGYKAAIILISAGYDPTVFALHSINNIFPNWNSTAIAAIGTIRSLSFANGLILRAIWASNRAGISLSGIAFVWGGLVLALLLVAAFVVPWQPFPNLQTLDRDETLPNLKQRVSQKPKINFVKFYESAKVQVKLSWKYAKRWVFLLFMAIACVQLLRNSYYGNSYKAHLPDTKDFYEIASPLSVIPCPFMGILGDRVSAALPLCLMVACAAISMLFASFRGGVVTQSFSIVFNWLFQSFVSSEFYVYVAYNYPQNVYGKLAGFTLLVAGLIGLCGSSMNTYVDRTGNYAAMDIMITCFGAVALCGAVVLHFKVERKTRAIKAARKLRNK